jgi:hypothetical protein
MAPVPPAFHVQDRSFVLSDVTANSIESCAFVGTYPSSQLLAVTRDE